uniref:Uncharacterized protein n=1 Tax=Lepeophtheirus salmonis TaxID=72036 RepID=A0A0K2US84_LEPSM
MPEEQFSTIIKTSNLQL